MASRVLFARLLLVAVAAVWQISTSWQVMLPKAQVGDLHDDTSMLQVSRALRTNRRAILRDSAQAVPMSGASQLSLPYQSTDAKAPNPTNGEADAVQLWFSSQALQSNLATQTTTTESKTSISFSVEPGLCRNKNSAGAWDVTLHGAFCARASSAAFDASETSCRSACKKSPTCKAAGLFEKTKQCDLYVQTANKSCPTDPSLEAALQSVKKVPKKLKETHAPYCYLFTNMTSVQASDCPSGYQVYNYTGATTNTHPDEYVGQNYTGSESATCLVKKECPEFEEGVDYPGNNVTSKNNTADARECSVYCFNQSSPHFTFEVLNQSLAVSVYNATATTCWCKSSLSAAAKNKSFTSGPSASEPSLKWCTTTTTTAMDWPSSVFKVEGGLCRNKNAEDKWDVEMHGGFCMKPMSGTAADCLTSCKDVKLCKAAGYLSVFPDPAPLVRANTTNTTNTTNATPAPGASGQNTTGTPSAAMSLEKTKPFCYLFMNYSVFNATLCPTGFTAHNGSNSTIPKPNEYFGQPYVEAPSPTGGMGFGELISAAAPRSYSEPSSTCMVKHTCPNFIPGYDYPGAVELTIVDDKAEDPIQCSAMCYAKNLPYFTALGKMPHTCWCKSGFADPPDPKIKILSQLTSGESRPKAHLRSCAFSMSRALWKPNSFGVPKPTIAAFHHVFSPLETDKAEVVKAQPSDLDYMVTGNWFGGSN